MKNGCSLSIIIPVYQAEKTIERCVRSVLKQNFPLQELLLIDDGSTDGTRSVLEKFACEPKIKLFFLPHGGVSEARNFGIAHATGSHLLFCDGDDEYLPDRLSSLWEEADESCDMTVFGAMTVNLTSDCLPDIYPREATFFGEDCYRSFYRFSSPFVWHTLYSRSFLKDNDLFFPPVPLGEDRLFQLSAFCHAKKVQFLSLAVYLYYYGTEHSVWANFRKQPTVYLQMQQNIVRLSEQILSDCRGGSDRFFNEWTVDFLFSPFLRLSRSLRAAFRAEFLSCLPVSDRGFSLRTKVRFRILKSPFLQSVYRFFK